MTTPTTAPAPRCVACSGELDAITYYHNGTGPLCLACITAMFPRKAPERRASRVRLAWKGNRATCGKFECEVQEHACDNGELWWYFTIRDRESDHLAVSTSIHSTAELARRACARFFNSLLDATREIERGEQ